MDHVNTVIVQRSCVPPYLRYSYIPRPNAPGCYDFLSGDTSTLYTNQRMAWFRNEVLTPRSRIFLYLSLAATILLLYYQLILNQAPTHGKTVGVTGDQHDFANEPAKADKELVFAAMESSNMSWVEEQLSDWTSNIYRADAKEGLTVPMNKGNEAMVYLTYVCSFVSFLP